MKITYIYHSGFAIETADFSIVVDFYKDSNMTYNEGYIHETILRREVPLYVLSSHSHPDHFNPDILKWKEKKSDITYIFSEDIREQKRINPDEIHFLTKGDAYSDALLSVKAFGSTDIGISFLMNIHGKKVFHAGDLNNWHWKDESTPEEVADAEKNYLDEIKLLSTEYPEMDVVMFPVDPRMGSDYMRGAEQFIDRIQTKLFIPMHFGLAYEETNAFQRYAERKGVYFMKITRQGQSIEY